ncbi:hypothetical protein BASA61_002775 [Batrachochytrium salamandrivorans]|nr:hypothetical protein BASA61_002775 [Batrachochytrium salamandrivorans]
MSLIDLTSKSIDIVHNERKIDKAKLLSSCFSRLQNSPHISSDRSSSPRSSSKYPSRPPQTAYGAATRDTQCVRPGSWGQVVQLTQHKTRSPCISQPVAALTTRSPRSSSILAERKAHLPDSVQTMRHEPGCHSEN